jgi:hypothetical protein
MVLRLADVGADEDRIASASPRSSLRSASTSFAPSSAKRAAAARPMPPVAPLMMATLLRSSFMLPLAQN